MDICYCRNIISCTHLHILYSRSARCHTQMYRLGFLLLWSRPVCPWQNLSTYNNKQSSDLHWSEAACPCLPFIYHFLSGSLVIRSASRLGKRLGNEQSRLTQSKRFSDDRPELYMRLVKLQSGSMREQRAAATLSCRVTIRGLHFYRPQVEGGCFWATLSNTHFTTKLESNLIYMWVFVRNTAGQMEWRDRGVPTVITESSAMVIKHACWILGLPPNSRLSTGRPKFH